MTAVCEIYNGVTTYRWLCQRHQSDLRGSGWMVKPIGRDAPFRCDGCVTEAQLVPGYVTPTVAFVQTGADARRPTAKECPPPKMPEQWADRLARLRMESAA